MVMQLRSGNSGAPFVGTNNLDTLLWDATRLGWYTGPGSGSGAVSSIFGRIGAVVAQTGDYDSDQIDNLSTVSGASVSDALDTLALSAGAVASVFSRTGVVVAQAGDYAASQVNNDSSVTGATVKAALNALLAAIPATVSSVFGRTGAVVATLNDYAASLVSNDSTVSGATVKAALNTIATYLSALAASQVANDSTVSGATVKQALETLAASGGTVSSVFGRVGAVIAAVNDYAASQVANDSGVTGATVKAALDALEAAIVPAPVSSVFGRVGAVVAAANDYAATQLSASATARVLGRFGAGAGAVQEGVLGRGLQVNTALTGLELAVDVATGDTLNTNVNLLPSGVLKGTVGIGATVNIDVNLVNGRATIASCDVMVNDVAGGGTCLFWAALTTRASAVGGTGTKGVGGTGDTVSAGPFGTGFTFTSGTVAGPILRFSLVNTSGVARPFNMFVATTVRDQP